MSRFTLDTNIFINMVRQYPRDIFTTLWDSIENAASANDSCICEAVLNELSRGTDDLHEWAKNLDGLVCKVAAKELALASAIGKAHPDWVRGQRNAADPFIVAHASYERSTIVTEERLAGPGVVDKNQKIPNIAAEHGVGCISFFDYIKEQGWQF